MNAHSRRDRKSWDAQVAGFPRSRLLRLPMRSNFLSKDKNRELLLPSASDRAGVGAIAKDQRRRLDEEPLSGFNQSADLSTYPRKISVRTTRATAVRPTCCRLVVAILRGPVWVFIPPMETRHAHEFILDSVDCECGDAARVSRDRILIEASVSVPLRRRLSELRDDPNRSACRRACSHTSLLEADALSESACASRLTAHRSCKRFSKRRRRPLMASLPFSRKGSIPNRVCKLHSRIK
jgi:hypothetical protein